MFIPDQDIQVTTCYHHEMFAAPFEKQNISLVMGMFENISEAMTTQPLDNYFSRDFEIFSNNTHLDYASFKEHLETAFCSLKAIKFKRPFDDLFAKDDRVVARTTIVTTDKEGNATETEFMAIFQIKDHKIYRWWELTYPDWQ